MKLLSSLIVAVICISFAECLKMKNGAAMSSFPFKCDEDAGNILKTVDLTLTNSLYCTQQTTPNVYYECYETEADIIESFVHVVFADNFEGEVKDKVTIRVDREQNPLPEPQHCFSCNSGNPEDYLNDPRLERCAAPRTRLYDRRSTCTQEVDTVFDAKEDYYMETWIPVRAFKEEDSIKFTLTATEQEYKCQLELEVWNKKNYDLQVTIQDKVKHELCDAAQEDQPFPFHGK